MDAETAVTRRRKGAAKECMVYAFNDVWWGGSCTRQGRKTKVAKERGGEKREKERGNGQGRLASSGVERSYSRVQRVLVRGTQVPLAKGKCQGETSPWSNARSGISALKWTAGEGPAACIGMRCPSESERDHLATSYAITTQGGAPPDKINFKRKFPYGRFESWLR